jgi:hypothetical protein
MGQYDLLVSMYKFYGFHVLYGVEIFKSAKFGKFLTWAKIKSYTSYYDVRSL